MGIHTLTVKGIVPVCQYDKQKQNPASKGVPRERQLIEREIYGRTRMKEGGRVADSWGEVAREKRGDS